MCKICDVSLCKLVFISSRSVLNVDLNAIHCSQMQLDRWAILHEIYNELECKDEGNYNIIKCNRTPQKDTQKACRTSSSHYLSQYYILHAQLHVHLMAFHHHCGTNECT
eukprot:170003_1